MNDHDFTIWSHIEKGAHLLVSVSGGKDSDCMSILLHDRWSQLDPATRGRFSLIHADVAGFEWPQSWPHCQDMADRLNVPIFKVAHHSVAKGKDFLDEVERKMINRPDAPPWSSSACRWCTSDWKRGPISKWIRNAFPRDAIVYSAIGLRAEESPARAKKPRSQIRKTATAPTKNRMVYDWHPILHYTLEDVWNELFRDTAPNFGLELLHWHQEYYQAVGEIHPDYQYHPAYAWGNERVSCACCVLANENDLANGIEHEPDIFNRIVELEKKSGYTFLPKKSITEVKR